MLAGLDRERRDSPRCRRSRCARRCRAAARPGRGSAARACAARPTAGTRRRESASTAVSGRNAVPALPRNRSVFLHRNAARAGHHHAGEVARVDARCRASAAHPASRACRRHPAGRAPASRPWRARRAAARGWRCSSSPAAGPCPRRGAIGARSQELHRSRTQPPFSQRSPRRARLGEQLLERRGIAALASMSPHLFKFFSYKREFVQQAVAVRDADVAPHLRMAGGDAREIAEAAGGVAEQLRRVRRARDLVDQRVGEQVRQVAHRGEHPVVLLRRHARDARAERGPEARQRFRRPASLFSASGVSTTRRPRNSSALRRRRAAVSPRRRSDAPGTNCAIFAAQALARRGHHVALGAAGVGDQRIRLQMSARSPGRFSRICATGVATSTRSASAHGRAPRRPRSRR